MKPISYYNGFWYRFTKPVKRLWFKFLLSQDKLIKVDDRHRGVGKTYMLIERAIKHDIPVLAGNQQSIDLIKRYGNPVEVHGFAKNFTIHVAGRKFPNGVLIDDSVDPDMIQWLYDNRINIRGGFIQNSKDDKQ